MVLVLLFLLLYIAYMLDDVGNNEAAVTQSTISLRPLNAQVRTSSITLFAFNFLDDQGLRETSACNYLP